MKHFKLLTNVFCIFILVSITILYILSRSSEVSEYTVTVQGQIIDVENSGWTSALFENAPTIEWGDLIALNLFGKNLDNETISAEKIFLSPNGSPNLKSIQEVKVSEDKNGILNIEHSPWPKLWQAGPVQYIGYHIILNFTKDIYFVVESDMSGNMLDYLNDTLDMELADGNLSVAQATATFNHEEKEISLIVTKHLLPILCIDNSPVLVFSHNNGTLYENSDILPIDISGDEVAELLVLSSDSVQLLLQGGYLSKSGWQELEINLGELYLKQSTQNEGEYLLYHLQNGETQFIQAINNPNIGDEENLCFSEERLSFSLLPKYEIKTKGNKELLHLTAQVYIDSLETELLLDCCAWQVGDELICSFSNP